MQSTRLPPRLSFSSDVDGRCAVTRTDEPVFLILDNLARFGDFPKVVDDPCDATLQDIQDALTYAADALASCQRAPRVFWRLLPRGWFYNPELPYCAQVQAPRPIYVKTVLRHLGKRMDFAATARALSLTIDQVRASLHYASLILDWLPQAEQEWAAWKADEKKRFELEARMARTPQAPINVFPRRSPLTV